MVGCNNTTRSKRAQNMKESKDFCFLIFSSTTHSYSRKGKERKPKPFISSLQLELQLGTFNNMKHDKMKNLET